MPIFRLPFGWKPCTQPPISTIFYLQNALTSLPLPLPSTSATQPMITYVFLGAHAIQIHPHNPISYIPAPSVASFSDILPILEDIDALILPRAKSLFLDTFLSTRTPFHTPYPHLIPTTRSLMIYRTVSLSPGPFLDPHPNQPNLPHIRPLLFNSPIPVVPDHRPRYPTQLHQPHQPRPATILIP